jgi:hypothetical protein
MNVQRDGHSQGMNSGRAPVPGTPPPRYASAADRWWEQSGSTAPAPGLWRPPSLASAAEVARAMPTAAAPSAELALASADRQRLNTALEAAQAENSALREILEDLPEIFERKFRQRVQDLIAERQRLLNDNQLLRDRLYAITPATPTAPRALGGERQSRLAVLPFSLGDGLRSALDGLRRRPRPAKLNFRRAPGRTRAA